MVASEKRYAFFLVATLVAACSSEPLLENGALRGLRDQRRRRERIHRCCTRHRVARRVGRFL